MTVMKVEMVVIMVVVALVLAVHVGKGQHLLQLTYVEDQGEEVVTRPKVTKRVNFPLLRPETRESKKPPHKPHTEEKSRKKRLFNVVQIEAIGDREDLSKNLALETPAIEVSGSGGRYGARSGASWSPWGLWSPCSVSCGRGQQYRFRACLVRACEGRPWELQECTKRRCRF
ncbi:ectin-like [Eriocheir sinensis]|uniref:ectin-like n=1 Tax=Eriocheir sinensis TaxID=95602 RepID=UPI0021C93FD5|nr:ectin-like [Eriocheir sinensis]